MYGRLALRAKPSRVASLVLPMVGMVVVLVSSLWWTDGNENSNGCCGCLCPTVVVVMKMGIVVVIISFLPNCSDGDEDDNCKSQRECQWG